MSIILVGIISTSGAVKWKKPNKLIEQTTGNIFDPLFAGMSSELHSLGTLKFEYQREMYESDSAVLKLRMEFNRGIYRYKTGTIRLGIKVSSLDFSILPDEERLEELRMDKQPPLAADELHPFEVILEWVIRPKKAGKGIIRIEFKNKPEKPPQQEQLSMYDIWMGLANYTGPVYVGILLDNPAHIEIRVLKDSGLSPTQEFYLLRICYVLAFLFTYPTVISFMNKYLWQIGN